MIEFACVYCGQPVRVGDELARKQIGCPACGHTIRVRPAERGKAQPASAVAPSETDRRIAERWDHMSNDEIREAVLVPAMPELERRRWILKRALAPWLPRYDDLTLFTFSFAFVVLFAVEGDLRRSLAETLAPNWTNPATAWFAIVALGALLCLVNVFFAREKSEFEKTLMLFFAVLVTVGAGFSAGRPMMSGGFGLLTLFPLWNILNGLILLILATFGILDEDCLTGERATVRQVLLATACITLLILACRYLWQLEPATAFSIAVVYTMSLHNIVRRFFSMQWRPAGAGGHGRDS